MSQLKLTTFVTINVTFPVVCMEGYIKLKEFALVARGYSQVNVE